MGKKIIDVVQGDRYGRLTVVKEIATRTVQSPSRLQHYRMVSCRCDCGNLVDAYLNHLRRGATVSCGCLRKVSVTKHGKCGTPTYEIWKTMRQRCLNPKIKRFDSYGGRGITVCDRWLDSFENFLEDMGERPEGYSIDRIDNDGNYEPSNCRWATNRQQQRNKRTNRLITHNGVTQCLNAWAEQTGITRETIGDRIKAGWTVEAALTTRVKSV